MKNDTLIAIPSYKRGTGPTTMGQLAVCGIAEKYDIKMFIYEEEPEKKDYYERLELTKEKMVKRNMLDSVKRMEIVEIPKEVIPKPNLCTKRQYLLDYAKKNGYKYVYMMDDDLIICSQYNTVDKIIKKSKRLMKLNRRLAATNVAFNESRYAKYGKYEKNDLCCVNIFFNLDRMYYYCNEHDYKYGIKSPIIYNPKSKVDDLSISLDLLSKGWDTLRMNEFVVCNQLRDVRSDKKNSNSGLSYRFEGAKDENGNPMNKIQVETKSLQDEYPDAKKYIYCIPERNKFVFEYWEYDNYRREGVRGEYNAKHIKWGK